MGLTMSRLDDELERLADISEQQLAARIQPDHRFRGGSKAFEWNLLPGQRLFEHPAN